MLRAEDLPVGTRVHDGDTTVTKTGDNTWHAVGPGVNRQLCDRQVDYLLDTGATAELPEPAEQEHTHG